MPTIKVHSNTLMEYLAKYAGESPEKTVYTILTDGTEIKEEITFAELKKRAEAIANQLLHTNASPGDRVLLLFPTGIDFIASLYGCMYAGLIAVPAYPPSRKINTLEGIVKDCSPSLILGTDGIHKRIQNKFPASFLSHTMTWITSFPATEKTAKNTDLPILTSSTLAILQYTSGSTGSPKGVMLDHQNLLSNLECITTYFNASTDTRLVGWLPLYHDMGLIGNLLTAVYNGSTAYLMTPGEFLQKPFRWLAAISKFRATASGGPNFAYQLCIDRVTTSQASSLDLSSWRVAFNGAEPVRPTVLENFSNKFSTVGYDYSAALPCYGLAEVSLLASCVDHEEIPRVKYLSKTELKKNCVVTCNRSNIDAVGLVSSGKIIKGLRSAIVSPDTCMPCKSGEVGEIWLSGDSVSKGYWNDEERSNNYLRAEFAASDGCRYLRTGDLGFFDNEQLYVTGRLKDLIIIRGSNYYPNDIENAVSGCCSEIQIDGTVAFQTQIDGDDQLVIAQELTRQSVKSIDTFATAKAISKAVAIEFQIDVHSVVLLPPRTIPRTSSGKVQRSLTRKMFQENSLKVLNDQVISKIRHEPKELADKLKSQMTTVEYLIYKQVAEVLNLKDTELCIDSPLLELGIDSLRQLELVHRIQSEFNITVSAEDIFDGVSISSIAKIIGEPVHKEPLEQLIQKTVEGQKYNAATSLNKPMEFSIMYFSSDSNSNIGNPYEYLLKSVKYTDRMGFKAVWLPERHFHRFGGLFPNPSVLASAVAVSTKKIRIRAGSVILPLHNPIRVAEEWSIVDNLSVGRVDLAFGQGWNPNDFTLSPDNYKDRITYTKRGVDEIKTLWKGEAISKTNGLGQEREIQIYPKPVQRELSTWMTCSGGIERFIEAGALGMNVLTALLFQDISELTNKIKAYRQSLLENGYDPSQGHVTLMMHTYISEDMKEVRSTVKKPLLKYLDDSIDLWKQNSTNLESLNVQEKETILEFAFEKYLRTQSLCGTPESCFPKIQELHKIGVNEIASLVDFGVKEDLMFSSLVSLSRLKTMVEMSSDPIQTKIECESLV